VVEESGVVFSVLAVAAAVAFAGITLEFEVLLLSEDERVCPPLPCEAKSAFYKARAQSPSGG